jgi:predicted DNA-binding transcriptional regulator YafY
MPRKRPSPDPRHELDWYAPRLLTEGADVVVQSPPELVAAMHRHMEVVAALYQR